MYISVNALCGGVLFPIQATFGIISAVALWHVRIPRPSHLPGSSQVTFRTAVPRFLMRLPFRFCLFSVLMKPSWNFLSFSTKIEPELCPDSLQLRTMLRGWSSTCRGETASASVHSAISKTDCVPCRLPPIALPATRPTPWTTMTWTWRSWSRFLVYFLFFFC